MEIYSVLFAKKHYSPLDRLDSWNGDLKKKDKVQTSLSLLFTCFYFCLFSLILRYFINVITLSIIVTTISTADTNTNPPEVSIIADQSSIFAR